MAERRMFSIKIIDSDEFLDLPLEAQSLYFHLAMRADDDGFVNNAKRLVRTIGASPEDLKMLEDKRFVIVFDSGIVAIRHWKVHNQIKKDRYKETIFFEEKRQLICDENGAYIHPKCRVKAVDPNWIQTGTKVDPQYSIGKDSIDKVSLGKSSIVEERIEKINLGEGSVNTTPAPYYENKYEEVFSSDRAIAHLPTEEYFLEDRPYCEAQYLTKGQPRCEASNSSEEKFYLPDGDGYIPEALDVSCNVNARSAREPFAEDEKAFPSGGRGTALAVDEVLPSESDKALYDMRSESARDTSLKPVEDPYGRGIVRLTDGQLADLKSRLGESQLNRYMDKLASFISSRGARIRSHYDTINKWYEEDYKSGIAPPKSQAYEPSHYRPAKFQPEKPRYGNFDPGEAFRYALERSRRESEKELREEGVDI